MDTYNYKQQTGDTTIIVELEFAGTKTAEELFEEIILAKFRERYAGMSLNRI